MVILLFNTKPDNYETIKFLQIYTSNNKFLRFNALLNLRSRIIITNINI